MKIFTVQTFTISSMIFPTVTFHFLSPVTVREKEEVKFDVRGQRYLKYETIKGLQNALRNELKELKYDGLI